MEAARLREIDQDYRNHLQAFLNFSVKAERKVGKNKTRPVYSTFKKFFDYEKEISRMRAQKTQQSRGRFVGIGKYLKKGEK